MRSHPDVFDAIVCGAPDERWGQTVAAIISAEDRDTRCRRSRRFRSTAASSWPATRCPAASTSSTRWSARPRGKPDYTWAAAIVNAGTPGTRLTDGHRPVHNLHIEHRRRHPAALRCSPSPADLEDSVPDDRCTAERPLRGAWTAPGCSSPVAGISAAPRRRGSDGAIGSVEPSTRGPPPPRRASHPRPHGPSTTTTPPGSGNDTSGTDLDPAGPAWTSPTLDGQLYGEPLEATGRVFVATEADTVYALAADSGAVLWSTTIGTPVPSGDLPCGNISPTVGITSTPVVDPALGEIFVVGDELVDGAPHQLLGLEIYTGAVLLRQVVDPPGAYTPAILQRASLTLDQGRVVFGYGGNDGDCTNYHGWVVSVPESGGTPGPLRGGADQGQPGSVDGRRRPGGRRRGQRVGGDRQRLGDHTARHLRRRQRRPRADAHHAARKSTWPPPHGPPTTAATRTWGRPPRRCCRTARCSSRARHTTATC